MYVRLEGKNNSVLHVRQKRNTHADEYKVQTHVNEEVIARNCVPVSQRKVP